MHSAFSEMNKKEKRLLIRLHAEFIAEHGENIAIVAKKRFEATEEEKLIFLNLESYGFLKSQNGSIFQLTREGFIAAYETKHWFRAFVKKNPKWVFTTVVLGIIMPILLVVLPKLIECSKYEHKEHHHPSEQSSPTEREPVEIANPEAAPSV